MATDKEIVISTLEAKTAEELELANEKKDVTYGSNLIPLTPALVNAVLAGLKAGIEPKLIRRQVKDAKGKKLSNGQMRMIMEQRRAIYLEKNPTPVEIEEPTK